MDPVLKNGLKSPRGDFVQKFPFASMLKVSKTFFKPKTDCQVVSIYIFAKRKYEAMVLFV